MASVRIVNAAKADGRVAAIAPLLDELVEQGMYLSDKLRRDILDLADEP